MRVLGIESSSLVASVALVTDDIMTAEYTVDFKKTHSQTLLPMLDEIVKLPAVYRRYKRYVWLKDLTKVRESEKTDESI